MTIREYLKSLGATDAELSAKVVKRMEQAMLFDSDIKNLDAGDVAKCLEIIGENTKRGISALEDATRKLENWTLKVRTEEHDLQNLIKEAQQKIAELRNDLSSAETMTFSKAEARDGVLAYAAILKATKDILGNEATENVLIAAIEAASFIGYRGVMGPKNDNGKTNTKGGVWE